MELMKGVVIRNFNDVPFYFKALLRLVPWDRVHSILACAALTESDALTQVGVDSSKWLWVRCLMKDQDVLPSRGETGGSAMTFRKDGSYYKDHPLPLGIVSYAEVVEGFASQDEDIYEREHADAFLMPVNRYPIATPLEQMQPLSPGVLALKIKVQTAQKWGMIIWDHPDVPVVTSKVPWEDVLMFLL